LHLLLLIHVILLSLGQLLGSMGLSLSVSLSVHSVRWLVVLQAFFIKA
jgi:hypothetical protein